MTVRRRNPTLSRQHGGSKIGVWWTHELVAYGLDRFHRQHLRTPTSRELRGGISDLPSHSTILRIYGSISRMFRYHGYRVRPLGGQRGHPLTPIERTADGRFVASRPHSNRPTPSADVAGHIDPRQR